MKSLKCRFCNSEKLISKILINDFPLAPRSTKLPRFDSFDFDIGFCENCFLIQQLSVVAPEILYEEFKNDVIGEKLNNQKISFSKYISQFLNNQMSVLEMGSGNGFIIKQLAESNNSIKFIANDYNLNFENIYSNITKLDGDIHEYKFNEIDVFFSSHVFEHIENVRHHLKKIKSILKDGGALYISNSFI